MAAITIGVFVDTNVFLHFKDLSQLDLHSIISCDPRANIHVLIPLVVVKELDEHKELHRKEKIKERARNALIKIEKWEAEGKVRDLVSLKILIRESDSPRALNDDLAMSAIVDYRKAEPPMRIVVLSGDTAVKLRAKALGLEYIRLPENARLPPVPSEELKIIEENKRLKSRLPSLELTFENRKKAIDWPISVGDYEGGDPAPLEEVQTRHPLLEPTAFIPMFTMMPGMNVDQWNSRLRDYYIRYSAYLLAHKIWQNRRSNFLTLQLVLWNVGDGPARDIDLTILFSADQIRIHIPSELPRAPEPPNEPSLNLVSVMRPTERFGIGLGGLPVFPSVRPKSNVEGPVIMHYDDGMTGADYKIGRIKQSDGAIIPDLVLEYLGRESSEQTIEILAHCEEMTFDHKESTLKLRVVCSS